MSRRHRAEKQRARPSRRKRQPRADARGSRVNVIAESTDLKRGPMPPRTGGAEARATPTVPEEIRRRFRIARNLYYLPGGGRAFVDRGDRLTTRRDHGEVIASLAAIARARGWREVNLEGTARFKRHMGLAARRVGLEVRGVAPHARLQAEWPREQSDAHTRASQLPLGLPQTTHAGDRRPHAEASGPRPPASGAREWRGRLIDHGAAAYRHDPANEASYFVKLRTTSGEVDVWGVDLKRALRASSSQPVPGDEVVLRRVAQAALVPSARSRDGRDDGARMFQRHRYVIETSAFLEARADLARVVRDPSVPAREATRRHPDLAGTYLMLRAAQLAAERLNHTEDRQQFVRFVRRALAAAIGRGEAMTNPVLRSRDARRMRPPRLASPVPE